MALKQLLRGYPIIRNWTVFSNYIAPLQFVQNRQLQTRNTDLTDYTQLLTEKSYLVENTKEHVDFEKILKLAATNYTDLSLNEAINLMNILFKLSNKNNNLEDISNHIGFIRLCEVLNGNIRLMKTSDVIAALKILTFFKTSSKTFLIQSLLQVIRTTINEICLQDIIFIIFLLRKMESTPLRDALLIALPLVFEAQLPTKLDSDNVTELAIVLKFISQNNIKNPKLQKIIFESLLKHQHNINIWVAKSIFYSLCFLTDSSPITSEILANLQYIFITRAKTISIHDKMKILETLTYAANKKEQSHQFYNEALVDAFVNSALSSDLDFGNGINMLKTLNELNYVHLPLLEYLAAKCFENLDLLGQASYFKMSVLLEGFINADYKPIFWDVIQDAILKNVTERGYLSGSSIKFALHLIALDCYNSNVFEKAFSQNIPRDEAMKDIYVRELLLLYQSVKTLYPTYNGSWPSQNIVQYASSTKLVPPASYSLKAALECALGGPQYVHHDLKTKLGHDIDHMIVMRKGGYPMAINTYNAYDTDAVTYVEDIQTPNESQILLIFNLPNIAYAVNSQRLKSTWLLKMKSVEALIKCKTIVVNSNLWIKLSEHERVPYLMQAIKLKCDDIFVSVN